MGDGGTTIGVWIGDDETLLDRVDERLEDGDSRSQYVKDALALRLAVDDALAESRLSPATEREKRALVRQLVLDAGRETDV